MEIGKTFVLVLALSVLLTICMVEFLFPGTSVLNVSAVEAVEQIGVYWDKNCSLKVNSIDWGELSRGEVKEVMVYVRNEGNESFLLVLTPINWDPEYAPLYLDFSWSCEYTKIGLGEVVNVTQSLFVSPYTRGISNFSFDIVFEGRTYFLGDVNRDGVVDMHDLELVCLAFMSTPKDPGWNPDADLNKDDIINMRDVTLVCRDFGKTWEP